jgi:hypothetical protein
MNTSRKKTFSALRKLLSWRFCYNLLVDSEPFRDKRGVKSFFIFPAQADDSIPFLNLGRIDIIDLLASVLLTDEFSRVIVMDGFYQAPADVSDHQSTVVFVRGLNHTVPPSLFRTSGLACFLLSAGILLIRQNRHIRQGAHQRDCEKQHFLHHASFFAGESPWMAPHASGAESGCSDLQNENDNDARQISRKPVQRLPRTSCTAPGRTGARSAGIWGSIVRQLRQMFKF